MEAPDISEGLPKLIALGAPEELAAQFADVPQAGAKRSAVLTWL